jgi:hypothetical protein
MLRFYPAESRSKLWGQALWFLAWLFVTTVAISLTPSQSGHATHTQLGLAPCPSATILHRPCPGCGLTTAFTATVHGDFGLALKAHPLGSALYLLFTASALACGYGWVRKLRFNTDGKEFNRLLGWIVCVFLVVSMIRFAVVNNYTATGHKPPQVTNQQTN